MTGCITSDWRDTLTAVLTQKVLHSAILEVVKVIPICGTGVAGTSTQKTAEKVEKAREGAKGWGKVLYFDEKCRQNLKDSPSGLFKELFGVEVTEDEVCRIQSGEERKECRALSVVENFRNRGYHIAGDGEEAPMPKGELSSAAQEREYKEWKEHLLKTGKMMRVYHPDCVAESIGKEK